MGVTGASMVWVERVALRKPFCFFVVSLTRSIVLIIVFHIFFSFGLSATAAVVMAVVVAMTGFAPFCGRSDGVRKVKSVAVVGERVIIIEQRD